MMDEPTAGVDIGTKSEILDVMSRVGRRRQGRIVISSELPELLAVSDRILCCGSRVEQEILAAPFRGRIPSHAIQASDP